MARRWYEIITVNIYYLGLSTVSQTLAPLVLPLLTQEFVGEARKATYYGTLRLWGLMVALLAQALWGMLSDRSRLRWGRRRPFIFLGTLLDLVFIAGIALSAGMSGVNGFWFMFAMYLLLQLTVNIGHGALQGLIPDLVPEAQRGRYSAVKAVFEIPLPTILVSFTIGRMIARGNTVGGIVLMSAVLVLTMALTLFTREERYEAELPPLDWTPFVRLVSMTAVFTLLILGSGGLVRLLGTALSNVALSAPALIGAMSSAGLLAMTAAIALGVWACTRISLPDAPPQQRRAYIWWIINRLGMLTSATNLSTFAVYFLQARLNLERQAAAKPAAQLLMFIGIAILIFALSGGWLADRFGRKRMVLISGLTATLGTIVVLLLPNLSLIYVGGAILGAALGLFYTANWALGTSLVPREQAGRYLGIANLAGAGAGAVGAYIGGPIADYFTTYLPTYPGVGYIILFALYGALFLLSTLALIAIREPAAQS